MLEPESFTYKGIDYIDANHSSTILVTDKVIEDNNLQEFIDTNTNTITLTNCGPMSNPYDDDWSSEEEEQEVTLAFNGLPIDLLSQEGVVIDSWFH